MDNADNIRVKLSNGQWWDIKPLMTHGMRRRINEMTRKTGLAFMLEVQQMGLDMESLNSNGAIESLEWTPQEEDAALLEGSIAWSFEESISQETIDQRNEQDVQAVLIEMKKRYALRELTFDQKEEAKKG